MSVLAALAFASCLHPAYRPWVGFDALWEHGRSRQLKHCLFLGDFVYPDWPDPSNETSTFDVTALSVPEHEAMLRRQLAASLGEEEFTKFDAKRGGQISFMLDDHEFTDNFDAAVHSLWEPHRYAMVRSVYRETLGFGGLRDVYREKQSFGDYQVSLSAAPAADRDALYFTGRLHNGKRILARFFVMDTRSYRSSSFDPDGPQKTMLGRVQRDSLQTWLSTRADHVWTLLFSPAAFNDQGFFTSGTSDGWLRYQHERNEIFDLIASLNLVSSALLLSGDSHWSGLWRYPKWGLLEMGASPFGAPPLRAPSSIWALNERVIGRAESTSTCEEANPFSWGTGVHADANQTEAAHLYSETLFVTDEPASVFGFLQFSDEELTVELVTAEAPKGNPTVTPRVLFSIGLLLSSAGA